MILVQARKLFQYPKKVIFLLALLSLVPSCSAGERRNLEYSSNHIRRMPSTPPTKLSSSSTVIRSGKNRFFLIKTVFTAAKPDTNRPVIAEANALAPTFAKIYKETILVSDPAKPFPRAPKGTVIRKAALALYTDAVENLWVLRLPSPY